MPGKDKVPCGYVAIMKQTLFEEYELRNALFQSQKMEISGRIASGAFHNVNNFLSIISMSCHLLKKTVLEGSEERELIQKISDSVQISSKIIRQIMAFLKEDTVVSELIDLNDTVSSFSPVLEVIVPSGVKFDIEYPKKSMKVRLVPSHLEQILSNIVLNAAKYGEKAKNIRVSIENKSSIEEIKLSHFVLPAGEYALLRIFNDGKAMEAETMDRIFRPFATSNELHDGTGLGLFTVFEQIKYNNGGIDVKSSMGYGTEFQIYFPQYKASKTKKKPE